MTNAATITWKQPRVTFGEERFDAYIGARLVGHVARRPGEPWRAKAECIKGVLARCNGLDAARSVVAAALSDSEII